MLSKRFASLVLILGAGVVLFVSGCGGSSSGPGSKDPLIMYLNSCQDGPVVFFANDENVSGTLAYRAKTGFKSLPFIDQAQGGYDISIEEPDRSEVWDTQFGVFQKDTSSVIAAVGVKNPPPAELTKRLKLVQFSPDRTTPIGNRARLLFFHAFNRKSPFGTPQLVLQTAGDQPLFQSETTDYSKSVTLEVDSGRYKSDPNPSLDTHWLAKDPDNEQIYAQNLDVTLEPGGIYIVLVSGVENANANIKSTIQFLKIPPDDTP